MANEPDLLGTGTLFGGSLTSCIAAPNYLESGDHLVMIISALGAFVAVLGLIYTIWSGERSYRLQLRQTNIEIQRLRHDDNDDEGQDEEQGL